MDSFVFYRSFAEAMEDLPPEDFKELTMALTGYALDGVEPELPSYLRPLFVLMRPNIEANKKKRSSGKLGGRPKTDGYDVAKPMVSEVKTNGLENENQWFHNQKPMVSNSKTNGYDNAKPNEDGDEDVNANKDGDADGERESEGRPSAPSSSSRHHYGQYRNVLLSDQDLEKLKKEFPFDWQERIDRVDAYVQMHGKPYKDYLATIRAWARKDQERAPETKARTGPLNNFSETGYQNDDYARILEENRRRLEERVANIGK